jgi:S1-C subfamily serine protease
VHSSLELLGAVSSLAPQTATALVLQRGSKKLEVRIQVAERPSFNRER